MQRIRNTKALGLAMAMGVIALVGRPVAGDAQVITNLHSFGAFANDGQSPEAPLIVVGSNTLYGTTTAGGGNGGFGTVFAVNTDGSGATNLHEFGAVGDGRTPRAALVQAGANTLYGTTSAGGTNNDGGTIFAIDTDGSNYTILHQFGVSGDGRTPEVGLILVGATLFGTTFGGGTLSKGTIFAIDTNGSGYTNLYSFGTTVANDGESPWAALTAIGSRLYGTTYYGGGPGDKGAIFAIDTNGSNYAVLYRLGTVHDGANPKAPLTPVGSVLYGTTFYGGMIGDGTVFKISADGSTFTNLHQFEVSSFDGQYPNGGLTLIGSTLYGTTTAGGFVTGSGGTIYAINTNGTGYTILNELNASVTDPKVPLATLTAIGSNTLYGTSRSGGANAAGTVFKFTIPTNEISTIDCVLTPALATNIIGTAHTVTATVTSNGIARVGALVNFRITTGPHVGQTGTDTTSASGTGSFTYTGTTVGTDTIRAISLSTTGFATKVWVAVPVNHDLAIVKMKAPKKITLSSTKPSVTGKFTVTVQNNGDTTEFIPDLGTLANLVTLTIQSLGGCTNPVAVLTTPKFGFPFNLAPKKKLNLAYTALFDCANDPLATSKTEAHNDYQVSATASASVLGGADSVPANDACPHNPVNGDKGCGGKTPAGTLGADIFTDVVVK